MVHGGRRTGAGRKAQYGCKTKAIRVPMTMVETIQQYIENKGYVLPLYESKVPAGFPSPADDHLEKNLDLNDFLIKHPAATFLVRVSGLSMINAGIHENDILVVDRSLQPAHGKIVIAAIDGQLTVKRLHKNPQGKFELAPENPDFQPIVIEDGNEVYIWGVVTNVIHSVL
jgi:DNA polymerase V